MKLPSIQQVGVEYGRTFRRFPLVILAGLVGSIAAIILVEYKGPPGPTVLFNILLASVLALPLLTTFQLAHERAGTGGGMRWGWQLGGLVLLAAYALTVPSDLTRAPMVHMFRFAAFAIGLCLLLIVYPFRSKGQVNGFWQFDKILVFRAILTGAFAAVLFAGLGLALAALNNLFGMKIPPKTYFDLWILILGIFSLGFFLAGVPEKLDQLEEDKEYPKVLKVFGQYLLSPLVLVYFVILYAYIAKIVFTWDWPQGWVGRLILGFAATGILAFFVLDPIRERIENKWMKRASRWYYAILLPLVVVLFLALSRRVSDYGITEDRYLGYAIGVWLAVIALYFIISKTKSIKAIPVTLAVLAFLISIGPWGMFSVAEKSQIGRLHEILVKNEIIKDGFVQKAPATVPDKDVTQISSIISYLHEVHGYDGIQTWFKESLREDTAGARSSYKEPSYVTELMGVEFNAPWQVNPENGYVFTVNSESMIPIAGYDQMVRVWYGSGEKTVKVPKEGPGCRVKTKADTLELVVLLDGKPVDSLAMELRPLVDRLVKDYATPAGRDITPVRASEEFVSESIKARVILMHAYVRRDNDTLKPINYEAVILYSRSTDKN